MVGRLRQICRGENIDIGEAAKYRALWKEQSVNGAPTTMALLMKCPHRGGEIRVDGVPKMRNCPGCNGHVQQHLFACSHPAREPDEVTVAQDCQSCLYKPRELKDARQLILKNHLSPGDVLAMSAAIHSLHKANPGKFLTAVDTTCPSVWDFNPDVIPRETLDSPTEMQVHYPAIQQCNQRGIHFLQAYCEFLEDALQVRCPLLVNRPLLYLSKREKSWMNQVEEITQKPTKFWLVNAGRKADYTAKHYGAEQFQHVVNLLHGRVLFVQVGSAEHHHPPLRNVINLVGKTDTRQLIRLAHHAQGVLCGVTFLQHIAAALEKPCVCIMGGREPSQWNQYPRQQLLHTVGLLPCCESGGCWKSRTVKLNDGDPKDNELCDQPVWGEEPIPRCMSMIRPEYVAETVLTIAQAIR